ncbi:hypothetical protein EZV73_26740 [Acidaminobacter sp. JC074]|uniref:NUMOD4 domain-containing protein n=1 Tax=Acidaminobacter sp. JC074 TaxID=2530199 RepID=UPI001F0FCB2B|nr:NUMOD4 domain-containing protein [Acidaminobacter sp. JC074]MCH4891205.1 hypothetical protein [Acidaminobacter sp. JC074]
MKLTKKEKAVINFIKAYTEEKGYLPSFETIHEKVADGELDEEDLEWIVKDDFKDIKGFEGYYQHNSQGIVRSLDRKYVNKRGQNCFYTGQIMKYRRDNHGSLQITLSIAMRRTSKRFEQLQREYKETEES